MSCHFSISTHGRNGGCFCRAIRENLPWHASDSSKCGVLIPEKQKVLTPETINLKHIPLTQPRTIATSDFPTSPGGLRRATTIA
jgi:hypothetical protein